MNKKHKILIFGGGQFGSPSNRSRGNPKIGLGIW